MALDIGTLVAYIEVNGSKAEATLTGFQERMRQTGDTASRRFQAVGQSISGVGGEISGVGRDLTGLAAPAIGAVGAIGGITAALGWGRLTDIDSAQAQLRGLGYEAQDVERISGQVSNSLEGGMATLGEGTRIAAGALAAGVQEGAELERYIKLVDAAAVGMNATTDETAAIFNRIQGGSKVMRNELDMVEQRMPGFSNALQEHVGESSQEEFLKMVSNGEVGSEEFLDVMENFAGGMAEEFSKSFSGMAANAKAYVGIIGQQLLGGVFEQSKDALAEFVGWLSDPGVQAKAAELGASIGSAFTQVLGAVRAVVGWFLNLDSGWQKIILGAVGFAVAIGPVLLIIGKIVTTVGMLITTFGTIIGWVSKLSVVFTAVGKVIGLATTAFRLLGIAMMTNPIGFVITLVAALVAALIYFFAYTDTGREIWSSFMDWLGSAWVWLKDTAVAVFGAVVDAIVGAWEWIRDTSMAIWGAVTGWITDNWSTIVDFLALLNPVTAVIRHWDRIKEASSAAWQWVRGLISKVWISINSAVINAVSKVLKGVTNAWSNIRNSTQSAWQSILSTVTNIFNRIRSAVVNAAQRVVSAVVNAWNNARNRTTSAFSAIRSAVSNGINGVVSYVRGLPGRVLSALGNLGSLLVGSGRALIDGFTRGIRNAFGNAVNAVKNGVQRVRNFFPFSPAKEGPFSGSGYTTHSGAALIEDFAKGMSSAESDVVRQAEAITRAAALEIPGSGLSTSQARLGGASQGGAQVVNNFTVNNPVEEPSSETARKASAYIGVTI